MIQMDFKIELNSITMIFLHILIVDMFILYIRSGRLLVQSIDHLFIHSLTHSLIYSFVRSFINSFI